MSLSLCNQTASSLLGGSPPFDRVIALDYNDGPTAGAVRCASGTGSYRFDLLAIDVDGAYDQEAWDRGEELRVYGLAPLPPGSFERIVGILTGIEPPRWPVWAPGTTTTAALDDRIEQEVILLLEAAGPPTLVAAGPGLLAPFRAAREIGSAGIGQPLDRDWLAYLGLR